MREWIASGLIHGMNEKNYPQTTKVFQHDMRLLTEHQGVHLRSDGEYRLLLVTDPEVPLDENDAFGWVLRWVGPYNKIRCGLHSHFHWDGAEWDWVDIEEYTTDPLQVEALWQKGIGDQ